jgi:6-phosphogluconate dehydrogenase
MQLAMVGLGRMGANMVRRLIPGGHECLVFERSPAAVTALVQDGASGAISPGDLAGQLGRPRAVWLMVPAAAVDATIAGRLPHPEVGDILNDDGSSWYGDDLRQAAELAERGIHSVDVGTSGGVWADSQVKAKTAGPSGRHLEGSL